MWIQCVESYPQNTDVIQHWLLFPESDSSWTSVSNWGQPGEPA